VTQTFSPPEPWSLAPAAPNGVEIGRGVREGSAATKKWPRKFCKGRTVIILTAHKPIRPHPRQCRTVLRIGLEGEARAPPLHRFQAPGSYPAAIGGFAMASAIPSRSRPYCPCCEIPMRLSRVAPCFLGTTTKTYECQLCDVAIVRPLLTATEIEELAVS
jgi:hypothetical protein